MRPFVIDCDTGRDDALTLWLATQAGLPLAGVVASYGNTVLAKVVDNTARVLSFAGRDDVPLIAGLEEPFSKHKLFTGFVRQRQKDAGNGLCNLELPVSPRILPQSSPPAQIAQFLKDLAAIQGTLDYFIIGPASNFAAAAKVLGPDLRNIVANVTMMGGKLDQLWAQMPGADFNIACDPYAVDEVMRLDLPMRFVPMNATWPISIRLEEIEMLRPRTPLAAKAQELMIAHCRHFTPEPIFRFHDPSVMIAVCAPENYAEKKLTLICDKNSASNFGRLIESPRGTPCQVYRMNTRTQKLFKESILHWIGFENFICSLGVACPPSLSLFPAARVISAAMPLMR